ncbi:MULTISPECIES: class I SAM-dependent methyltransferase [unclassified Ruegeria]|uniref:class I SAM-dependent methyltransferase n=1 Tax=unclassified Ruegeria TaxID=2625375 RepID=UPI0014887804|nr:MULTISPECIES: class I SAM-dependent methyltransferase [unclassified Ruegeria]NOD35619.1 class I SAM-dependent methyltransferase [Ruegeria sp. HKCCD7296]NOD78708.1 class I SAM-dependent methyltransferase [Ruegeria sp. HKCCD4332]NOD88831.1 class I SAM-dependent methyltransferase [Ruegeria sp. HKCCD4318]NOD92099.1 class I SAM-dependent methyltransferase [Ruegeria sp. HKCCD4884]NOE14583.1 class I SAM-dependent methyltransferase [Ruegeria sp. HKCCD4318-2]
MGDGYLHRYFLNNGDKRLHKWVHYFDIYEKHFEKFRSRPIRMLEIGVHGGGSLEMWRDYFHNESQIVGIDINPECEKHAANNIDIHIGSQDDKKFLEEVSDKYGGFDVVLDDGSHVNSHVITTFGTLYERVSAHGTYMVEDMHTSYWPRFGGGLGKEGTFIEYAKSKIDELNAQHVRGDFETTAFTRQTDSITFYDSMVVFERRPQGRRQDLVTRSMK